jgi:hypothetical protein
MTRTLPLFLTLLLVLTPAPPAGAECYGHGYSYGSYYAPSYYAPGYGYNLYDGYYHYHEPGYWHGRWYPGGYYRWAGYAWYRQGYGYDYGIEYPIAPIAVLAPSVAVVPAYGVGTAAVQQAVPATQTVPVPQQAPAAPAVQATAPSLVQQQVAAGPSQCEKLVAKLEARLAVLEAAALQQGGNGNAHPPADQPPPATQSPMTTQARADGAPALFNRCAACHTEGRTYGSGGKSTTLALLDASGKLKDLSPRQVLKVLNRVGKPAGAEGAMPPSYGKEAPATDAEFQELESYFMNKAK